MVAESKAGYREIPHTADWELRVWAPDLPALMEQAAHGMASLAGIHLADNESIPRSFELPFFDREMVLVDFLSELLFYIEQEGIGFRHFEIECDENRCQVHAQGASIADQNKEIKAVTYHNLRVQDTEKGLTVNIVFDV